MTSSPRPRLSVVLPNYNHAAHLPTWFNAVLRQSVQPFEIIVIDDASTDTSAEIIGDFARKNPVIRFYRNEKNQGVVYGMNRGLALAVGEYLYFSASDDEILPGFFEKSLDLLAAHPQAALSCTISEWHDVPTGLRWHMAAGLAQKPSLFSPEQMVQKAKAGKLFIVTHSSLMRRTALCEAGGFVPELRWHCDWFAANVTGFRHGICYVPEVLSLVNIHPKSLYKAGHQKPEHQQVLLKLLELLNSKECADVAPRIRDGGVLAVFAMPMLRLLLSRAEYRPFLTPRLLLKTLRRVGELQAKRFLPAWLARWSVAIFYRTRTP